MSNPAGKTTISDEDARQALEHGDNQKIDKLLDELNVLTTASGEGPRTVARSRPEPGEPCRPPQEPGTCTWS
jgi:hypothetical protein